MKSEKPANTGGRIYLDHNATTSVRREVVEAMLPFYSRVFGNPSSIHSFGRDAHKAVEDAREKIAEVLGASPEEIVFTSGGTEADNLAIKGAAFANAGRGKRIITSAIEHHAVLNSCKILEKKGYEVIYLPVDNSGVIDLEALKKAVDANTILITVMHANNETGVLQPLAEIAQIARSCGALFHTDAVQSVGKVPFKVDDYSLDMLSLSAHKLYGPKGTGALYIRKGTKLEYMIQGGHHEKNRRAGTENVAGIVGLAKAVETASSEMTSETDKIGGLRDRLEAGIKEKIKDVKVNGAGARRLCNTSNISFAGVEGESIVLNLDLKGVAVSSGSACTSGALEPSHVLSAMGLEPSLAQGSVRFSLGRVNTEKEIDYTVGELPALIDRLRRMSPLYGD